MKNIKKGSFIALCLLLLIVESCSNSDDNCAKTCPIGFLLNEETCECEEEPCTKTCPTGFLLNEETCECEEEPCIKTCPPDYTLNEETCECIENPFKPAIIEGDASVVTLTGDWKKKTTISDYSGEGYIVWEGANQFWKDQENIGNVGRLTYTISVTKPGTYLFKWRSYIAKKDPDKPTTEHNDSWLKFPDADNFYGEKNGHKVYPKGSGKSPNPAGENGNGFFKVYMNTADAWSMTSSTSDNDAHQIYVTFNEAKDYTLEIAARSAYHAIDSFKLTQQKPE